MGWYPTGKFTFWVGQSVNNPLITPPASLRAMMILCILSLTGTLFFGVANQLSSSGAVTYSIADIGIIVGCYFLLPVLIAHTISTNWPICRVLIIAYFFAVAYQVFEVIGNLRISSEYRGLAVGGTFTMLLAIVWWLFMSNRLRVYYSLISGDGVPTDITGSPDELLAPGRVEKLFARVANTVGPYFEGAVVVIVLIALVYAFSLTGYRSR